MNTTNIKRLNQLGMPHGTANNRLRKSIMFSLVKKCGENKCFRCGKIIETVKEFSIEHKTHYLDEPNAYELFFSLDNIAFSHLKCNCEVSRRKLCSHGTPRKYDQGCRCEQCTEANTIKSRMKRKRKALVGELE